MSMLDNHVVYSIRGTDPNANLPRRIALKGDFLELLEENGLTFEDVSILPMIAATPREIAEVIGQELENANHHSMTSIAETLLNKLEAESFSENSNRIIMKALAETFESLI